MRRVLLVGLVVTFACAGVARGNDIGIQPVHVPAAILADAPGATGLTAYAGHVVWSRLDPATARWQLVQWTGPAGRISTLPVAERSVPFDASAGPSSTGRPVVVFSRCRREPPGLSGILPTPDWGAASGCELQQLALDPPAAPVTIRRVGAGRSLTTPSVWHGSLVAVGRTPSGANARVLWWRPGAREPVRLPGGSIPTCPFASCPADSMRTSVDALDLGPRSVVLDWRVTGGNVIGTGLGWELRTASLATRRSTIVQFGYVSGACGFHQPLAPGASPSGVATYLDAASPCSGVQTALARFDPANQQRYEARPDDASVLGAATDGAITYWLRSPFGPTSCTELGSTCQLTASTRVPYRLGRRGPDHTAVG